MKQTTNANRLFPPPVPQDLEHAQAAQVVAVVAMVRRYLPTAPIRRRRVRRALFNSRRNAPAESDREIPD